VPQSIEKRSWISDQVIPLIDDALRVELHWNLTQFRHYFAFNNDPQITKTHSVKQILIDEKPGQRKIQ